MNVINYETAVLQLRQLSAYVDNLISNIYGSWSPDCPPITLVFSAVGRYMAANIHNISNSDNISAWGVIESLLANGDDSVKDATATGLLEAALSETAVKGTSNIRLYSYLGKQSLSYCNSWNEYNGCSRIASHNNA